MRRKRGSKEKRTRFLGTFSMQDDKSVVGELLLKGTLTRLRAHSDSPFDPVPSSTCIEGRAYSGECLTLIDCNSPGIGQSGLGATAQYHADIFPHYVAIGQKPLAVDQPCIKAIHFTTTDLISLFYDFDAFSTLIDASPVIDAVLQERRRKRPVEAGRNPLVFYFTGKDNIVEVPTLIGKISVDHRPTFDAGGPHGVSAKNRIEVTIEPEEPTEFREAVDKMYVVATFLSMAAGRAQGISHIRVTTTEQIGRIPHFVDIRPSFGWRVGDRSEQHKPHPGDVLLDPISHRSEFEVVITDWIARHGRWQVARGRYLGCMRKANRYDHERLVAAANMFDILPNDAVPRAAELPSDLATTRDASVEMFSKHPPGIDRDSALSALGRLGRPSLPKKVTYRVSIVECKFGNTFPDLQRVAGLAVKCRNFLVHGSTADVDYQRVEPFLAFLTDVLEFVFAASDFIDAGWDAQRWNADGHGWGHNFSRLRSEYKTALAELRKAIGW